MSSPHRDRDTSSHRTFLTGESNLPRYLLIVGVVGLALSLLGYFLNPGRFYFAWLVAFAYWTTISLGALFFTMLHHVAGSTWSVVIRRGSEALSLNLPWLFIFFLPVLFGLPILYHWAAPEAMAHDPILQAKSAYLNTGFFIARGIIYFLIWAALAILLNRYSLAHDQDGNPSQLNKLLKVSAPGIVLLAFSATFAAFDWLMSLDPHWYSTIFGVYVFIGGFLTSIAFLTAFYLFLRKRGVLSDSVRSEHYHDLGRLIFAFTVFWAYIGGSQYFLIWYANIPEETVWYLHRWEGSWKTVSLLIVFLHFLLPFVALIFHATKRNTLMLALVASVLLIMHYVDMYWLIMPTFNPEGAKISWLDLTAVLGMGGMLLWLFIRRFAGHPALPINDPRLPGSIAHRL